MTASGNLKVIRPCQFCRKPTLIILSLLKSTIEVGEGVIVVVGVLLGISVGLAEGAGVLVGSGVGKAVSIESGVALGAFANGDPPAEQAARRTEADTRIDKRIK